MFMNNKLGRQENISEDNMSETGKSENFKPENKVRTVTFDEENMIVKMTGTER